MVCRWFLAGALAAALAGAAWGAPTGQALTLRECLLSALENHPQLRAARARVEAQGQAVRVQEAPRKPSLEASGSGRAAEGARDASAELRLSQLVTDGGKTDLAVQAAELEREAVLQDLAAARSDLVLEVQQAFYALVKAEDDLEVARRNVAVQEEQLARARAFFQAGKVPKSDVTAAEVDLGQARLEQTQASGTVEATRSLLYRTMGVSPRGQALSVTPPPWTDRKAPSVEAAQSGVAARPDLKAQGLRVEEASRNVALAAKDLAWNVAAWGGYGWSDPGTGEWKSGLTLSLPLLDGGRTDAKVGQARAKLEEARATEEDLRQKADLAVVEALTELRTAEESLRTALLVDRQARENLDLARGRYREGVGSPLEVSQAALNRTKAQRSLAKARHDLRIAWAKLEHGMGTNLADLEGEGR
ncbi:outer membrane efflux protein [Aminomonas paucivorans DSM 12260]|uniref:Outer membrane efflux protein n=1 Tax=Aminomonas paucivorans DSM 12260 TaxID=584708 RepID=E3CW60_9BACT|nr:TolC family protein [Aminomonas paucivorans]EFQ22518.1 outer membrane efflux protein [Aminomonas paucivorans DSM 12260]